MQIAMIRSGDKMLDRAVARCNTIHYETVMSFLETALGLKQQVCYWFWVSGVEVSKKLQRLLSRWITFSLRVWHPVC